METPVSVNDQFRDQTAGWRAAQTQTEAVTSGSNGSTATPKAVISSARLFRAPAPEAGQPDQPKPDFAGADSAAPATSGASTASSALGAAANRDETTTDGTDGTAGMPAIPAEPREVNVSYRFPRGLLPSRDPRTYILSPSDLLTRRAEDFRQLRTQIKAHLGDRGTVLIASPRHNEGRSITALNLAIAFAQEYERVVYVEADFRRPALHRFFELEQERGLSRLLQSCDPVGEHLGDELLPTDVPGFYLLPAGVRSGPPELFESPRMAETIERLKVEADWAIIDIPPMLTYAEPQTLARLVDGVVVIALEGRTHEDDLRRLAARLEAVEANIIGAVYVHRS
jgi:capsular exopolysaccharide synthesis family protein